MSAADFLRLACELRRAEQQVQPIGPPSDVYEGFTVADAYQTQQLGRVLREFDGATLVGRKIGLTSEAMQELLGVNEPDYGYLLDTMLVANGQALVTSELIAPRVEAEVAFILGRSIGGPDATRDDVLSATDAVAPALEVIDSRVSDWRIGLVDTVADNASCARAIVGRALPPKDLDLASLTGVLTVGNDQVEGQGDAVLGHPAEAVAWLARALAHFGEELRAGDVVLSGAVAKALPVAEQTAAVGDFGVLGSVSVRFT